MIETLHSLRFVFIMLIVVSHLVGSKFDFGGECGVSFFFILSGFVLSYAYGEKVKTGQFRTWSLLRRQLLKFYPLHLLMLVGIALIDVGQDRCYDYGGRLTALLKTPVMLWLGSISMEIYLTHIFVFRSVFSVLRAVGVSKAYVLMAIGVAVLLPVCYLTKRFFVDKIYASLLKYV